MAPSSIRKLPLVRGTCLSYVTNPAHSLISLRPRQAALDYLGPIVMIRFPLDQDPGYLLDSLIPNAQL